MTMKTIGMSAAVLGFALVLVGCSAPRGLQHKATRPVTENLDAPQDDVTAAFAATAGNLKLGQTVSVKAAWALCRWRKRITPTKTRWVKPAAAWT